MKKDGATRYPELDQSTHLPLSGANRQEQKTLSSSVKQTGCYSGKKKDHTVKNVLLINALLTLLFLSDTDGGRVHDKRMADATP